MPHPLDIYYESVSASLAITSDITMWPKLKRMYPLICRTTLALSLKIESMVFLISYTFFLFASYCCYNLRSYY
jgi:hypothetical protein